MALQDKSHDPSHNFPIIFKEKDQREKKYLKLYLRVSFVLRKIIILTGC